MPNAEMMTDELIKSLTRDKFKGFVNQLKFDAWDQWKQIDEIDERRQWSSNKNVENSDVLLFNRIGIKKSRIL